ncbi:MAG: YdcF family protein [Myxococcota bacterium]
MRLRSLLVAPVRAIRIDRHGMRPLGPGVWDAIVVPGCLVRDDGTPSGALRRRMDHGIALWRDGRAPVLVCSGLGRGGRPEADVMRDLALAAGVPEDAVLRERGSMNTAENARLTAGLLGAASVLVATDASHVVRCEREFGRWFDRVRATGVPLAPRSRARMAVREALREAWHA